MMWRVREGARTTALGEVLSHSVRYISILISPHSFSYVSICQPFIYLRCLVAVQSRAASSGLSDAETSLAHILAMSPEAAALL